MSGSTGRPRRRGDTPRGVYIGGINGGGGSDGVRFPNGSEKPFRMGAFYWSRTIFCSSTSNTSIPSGMPGAPR